MDESAKIDANQQKTLLAITNSATPEIRNVRCDANTGRVLVSATVSGISTIMVANEATDIACFPLFSTGTTGNVQPKTNAGLTFNSVTGNLGSTLMNTQKLTVGVVGTSTGSIDLNGITSGTVTLKVADVAGTYTLTLPTNDGNANQFLQTNGNGVLTWADITVSGGASTALDNLVNVAINTNLLPGIDNFISLGDTTHTWKTLFCETIELGHDSDTTLSRSAAGVLAVEGVVIPTISSADTLTNKRITPRVYSEASNATPTPNIDSYDMYELTALAVSATFSAPTGTPTDGQSLIIRIKDNNNAQSLSWNAIYRASTDLALPTTTSANKTMYLGFKYNSADSKWDLLAYLNNI